MCQRLYFYFLFFFRKLVKYDDWCSLVIHVAMDNTIITDEIRKKLSLFKEFIKNKGIFSVNLCDDDASWKSLLLIVPLRLGLNEINPIYINGLKRCFEISGNVGMIGGRPNQALYFIGYIGDEALYLDPHTTQRCGIVGNKNDQTEIEHDSTFHQKYAARINFKQMDPSLAVVNYKKKEKKTNSY